jgi:fructan beta-fructosidase
MSWMNGGSYPGMPFNQQMSCPYELKLCRFGLNSYRLFALPVQEIDALRGTPHTWRDLAVKPGDNPLAGLSGDLWDIVAEIEPGTAKEVGFQVRGRTVAYTVGDKALGSANLHAHMDLKAGRIKIRILVDRTSVETFGNNGEVVIPSCFLPEDENRALALFAVNGTAKVISLDVFPMRSAWPAR